VYRLLPSPVEEIGQRKRKREREGGREGGRGLSFIQVFISRDGLRKQ